MAVQLSLKAHHYTMGFFTSRIYLGWPSYNMLVLAVAYCQANASRRSASLFRVSRDRVVSDQTDERL